MAVSLLKIGLVVLALNLTGAASGQAPAAPATGSPVQQAAARATQVDWLAATREDVTAAYEIFSQHHPGMFDPNNSSFPKRLRRARDAALTFARNVHDAEGHMRALALFSAGLADGHARVQASYSGHGNLLWPGFRTVWRDHELHVLDNAQDAPPRGSILLACDGKDARRLIREAAFSFYGRPEEEGQWWTNAPSLFERVQSPYETLPRECSIRKPNGRTATYRLNWRAVPEQVLNELMEEGRREPIRLTTPAPGIYWITLSTFSPDDAGRAAFDRLFRDIDKDIAEIDTGRAIVLDLRRNNGGSSSWGEDVADHLWGKAAVDGALARYFRHTQIWWLADEPNIAHLRDFAAQVRAEGRPQDDEGIELPELASRLELARKQGKHFYVEYYGATLARKATDAAPRRLPPVYVIVDGGCASACLDALDTFTRFPGVRLVGAPTSADTQYMDIRFQPLPSGRGVVILPTKIWVHRPRRPGQIYRPDIPVNDLEWTMATMLDHIERDLAAR